MVHSNGALLCQTFHKTVLSFEKLLRFRAVRFHQLFTSEWRPLEALCGHEAPLKLASSWWATPPMYVQYGCKNSKTGRVSLQELTLICKMKMEDQPCTWWKMYSVGAWFYRIMAIPVLRRNSVKQRLSMRLRTKDGTFEACYMMPRLPRVLGNCVENLPRFVHHHVTIMPGSSFRDLSHLCRCVMRKQLRHGVEIFPKEAVIFLYKPN